MVRERQRTVRSEEVLMCTSPRGSIRRGGAYVGNLSIEEGVVLGDAN